MAPRNSQGLAQFLLDATLRRRSRSNIVHGLDYNSRAGNHNADSPPAPRAPVKLRKL
jgi:hypothetical protein